MKKLIIFTAIVTLGLLLGLFFSQKKSSPSSQSKISPPSSKTKESIPITGVSAIQPTYIIDQQRDFPSFITTYSFSTPVQMETISSFLTRFFSFSSEPKTIMGSKGTYSIWNESGKTLIVGGSPLEISYSVDASSTGILSSSVSQYEIAAFSFLSDLTTLFGGASPELTSTAFLSVSGKDFVPVNNPSEASVFLANYRLSLNNRPLVSRSFNMESISVGLDANKKILSFRTYVFPSFAANTEQSPILSYAEAKNALFSGKATLVEFSYTGEKTKKNIILQPSSPPARSTIYDIQLGYLFSPLEDFLAPVFLFSGRGSDSSGNTLSTTTVISATK